MTENYPPSLPPDDYLTTKAPPQTAASSYEPEPSVATVAKDQASGVGQGAVQAGQNVAGVARDQAAQVTAEAGRQVKDLLGQAQEQLSEQSTAQQQKLVGGLRSLHKEFTSMADNADQPGVGSDIARQAADRARSTADWLDGREPADVLSDVTAFARRRPGAFLAVAGVIGFVAGRLTRGLKAQSGPQDSITTTPPVTRLPPTSQPEPMPYPGPEATLLRPPAPAVGLGEPLAPPIVSDFPTPGYLGDAR